jgi:hypothetical protein
MGSEKIRKGAFFHPSRGQCKDSFDDLLLRCRESESIQFQKEHAAPDGVLK